MKDESQQLKDTYSQMLDGELEYLAGDMGNMTDLAKPLLLEEMERRGIPPPTNTILTPDVIIVSEPHSGESAAAGDRAEDDSDLPPIGDFDSRCPVCHSPDIVFLELEAAHASGAEAAPKFHWVCDHCEHEWFDDGLESQ